MRHTENDISLGLVVPSTSRAGGGIYSSARDLAQTVHDLGTPVEVYGYSDKWSTADRPEWGSLLPKTYPRLGPKSVGWSPPLKKALLRSKVQIIHQHGLWTLSSSYVARWALHNHKPVIVSPHGMLDPWALANAAWKKRLALAAFQKLSLTQSSCIHALNVAEAKAIRGMGFENPIAIIPNGVNLPGWNPDGTVPAREGDKKILLFLGRIHPKKGIADLIRAWDLLKRNSPDTVSKWRVMIAGWDDGKHLERYRSLASALDLLDDIEFAGPLFGVEKEQAYAKASAFILPSYSEGLPMTVLEAWAFRLPVFKTAACNMPAGFEAGAAVEIGNSPESIAKQLVQFLTADALLASIGQKGRALVEATYSWTTVAMMHRALHHWLVNGGTAPAFVVHAIEGKAVG